MAESGLTLGWADLKQAVGHYLNLGTTIANWSDAEEAEIEAIVQTGYRRVLYPPAIIPGAEGYEWSFLHPTTTLDIEADEGDYDLPDDFGRLIGQFHYAPDEYQPAIQQVSVAHILDSRSNSDENGYPHWCATRWKSSDQSGGQRQEVLFYPEPDDDYTLYYAYDAYTGALSDSYPYPLGGMQMSELYKESCLAVAESRNSGEIGLHMELFKALLEDAIARDRKRAAQNYGQMGAPDLVDQEVWTRGRQLHTDGAYSYTYNGVNY